MRPGERIGNYTIVRKIGEGGMSIVYLAQRVTDDAFVVVKQLKDQFRFDEQLIDRFVQGAKILQELRHPHLARVFDCLEHRGTYFMVEEHLPAGSLGDAIDAEECGYTEEEAIRWCRDALRAMSYAHANDIVHRDLKPSNLMLDDRRRVKVIDFGIARVFGEARITRTADGALGTPEYMSPEQILTPHAVDYRTDVYSMGVVLYELLTGCVPFSGETVFSVQERVTRQTMPPMKRARRGMVRFRSQGNGIDPRLSRIVARALEKQPHQRFDGCDEFARHLERYLKGTPEGFWDRVRAPFGRVPRAPQAAESPADGARGEGVPSRGVLAPVFAHPRGTGIAIVMVTVLAMLGAGVATGKMPWGGAAAVVESPGIALVAEARPAVVETPGMVTHRYTVSNSGNVPLNNVRVVAEGLAPHLESGDANGNGVLDLGESWIYVASMNASQEAFDMGAPLITHVEARSDRAASGSHRVEVALRPSASLSIASSVEGVDDLFLPAPGPATFRYQVTNTGSVSLSKVSVIDQHSGVPVLTGGDINRNGVLDVGETWSFSVRAPIARNEEGIHTFVSRAVADRAASAPDSVRVTLPIPLPSGSASPQRRVHVPPVYPADAKNAGVEGDVVVSLTVGPTGRVVNASVVRPIPLLDRAALDAVRQWVYEPPVIDGVRRGVVFNVGVEFRLAARPSGPPAPPALPGPAPTPQPGPGGIMMPVKIKHVDPEYPRAARDAGVKGQVVVIFTVTRDGRVRDARVNASIPLLDAAALAAVRQWQYKPATQNGKPFDYTVVATLTFPPAP